MSDVDPERAAMWLWKRSRDEDGGDVKHLLHQALRRTGQPNIGLLAEHEPELVVAIYEGIAPVDEDLAAMHAADGMLREIWGHRR